MSEIKRPSKDAGKEELWAYIHALEERIEHGQSKLIQAQGATVQVPPDFQPIFDQAMEHVDDYFHALQFKPENGVIQADSERYILVRSSSLACDFFRYLQQLYSDRDAVTAFQTGQDFLFDIGHVLGIEDAKRYSHKMNLHNPIEKLSAGPVHFAYAGWGFVEIHSDSQPEPNDNFVLKYSHPNSFEADSWLSQEEQSDFPVCIMNAAYSSGWCEESFGLPLTAYEINCRAQGDASCDFVMAPPHKIHQYLPQEQLKRGGAEAPLFFNRKLSEDQIRQALKEKEVLLQEVHHRVKNNLQVIVSLMALQINGLENEEASKHLRYMQNRISSIAMIHEMLYQSQDLSTIPYHLYIQRLLQQLIESLGDCEPKISVEIEAEDIYLGLNQAIPLGLILNELATNAIKHAFHSPTQAPCLQVKLSATADDNCLLRFSDNGSGFPPDFNFDLLNSLGLQLVQRLSRQIQGEIHYSRLPRGSCFELTFRVNLAA